MSKIQDNRQLRGDPPLPLAPPGPPTEPLPTPPEFTTGAALYSVPLKPCCLEVFRGEECGCDELIAQYLSAPVIWMGRRT